MAFGPLTFNMKNRILGKFREARVFLLEHPALGCENSFPDYINNTPIYNEFEPYDFNISDVCENGYDFFMAPPVISVWYNDKEYDKFFAMNKCKPLSPGLKYGVRPKLDGKVLEVDYAIYYGQPWKPIKHEVWMESGPRYTTKQGIWISMTDPTLNVSADSVEKAVIKIAQANKGNLWKGELFDLIFVIVQIKLIAPKIEAAPERCKLKIARSTAPPECAVMLDRGG